MRTNVVIDDEMLKKAFRYSKARTKKELIHEALKDFIDYKQRLNLMDLSGKI